MYSMYVACDLLNSISVLQESHSYKGEGNVKGVGGQVRQAGRQADR